MTTFSSITDWIQVCFAVLAGCYALFLFRQNVRERQKSFLLNIYTSLYNDNDISEVLYYVDNGGNQGKIAHQGNLEKQADKTLHYMDLIGKFLKDGDLKYKDLRKFQYEIKRILNNEEVKRYINWLNQELDVPLEYLPYLQNKLNKI